MKSKKLVKWSLLLLLILAIIACARLYYYLTDDFRLSNIRYDNPPYAITAQSLPTEEEKQEITNILLQPFYYMDKGAQSYAFVSADQQYVLKFFKFKHLKPTWYIQLLPSVTPFHHLKEHNRINKQRKLAGVFEGYEIAYAHNKKNSGLIYLHLAPTNFMNLQLTLFDKMGRKHVVDADESIFLLQKKGVALRDHLNNYFEKNQITEVKNSLGLILDMYGQEYQAGIYDRDHGILRNTGFVDSNPFHLDVGKLTLDTRIKDPNIYKQDLQIVIWNIEMWIKKAYPNYYPEIQAFLANKYHQMTGEQLDLSDMNAEKIRAWRHRQ